MLSLNWYVGQDTSVEIFDGCLGMAQNKMAKPSRLSRQALYTSLKEVRIYEGVTSHLAPKCFEFVVFNPCLSFPFLTIFVPLWFIIISLVFFYLCKVLFSGFLQFKGNFVRRNNNSKCRD